MRILRNVLLTLLVILIVVRIALPYVIRYEINKQLAEQALITGRVDRVGLSVIHGALRLSNLHLFDTTHDFKAEIPLIDTEVSWRALLHKAIVVGVQIHSPRVDIEIPKALNEMKAKQAEQPKPPKPSAPPQQELKQMPPFRLDSFLLRDGLIHVVDTDTKPDQDLWIRDIEFRAQNLTNSRKLSGTLIADADLSFRVNETGKGMVNVRLNPVAAQPTFELKSEVNHIHLPDLNPIFRNQMGLTVDSGTFSMYTEDAAAEGAFQGYVKPVITDLKMANPDKKKPLKSVEKAVIDAVAKLLGNSKRQVATRVPVQGRFDNPKIGITAAVVNVLRNALSSAIQLRLEGTPTLEHVEKAAPAIKKKS